MRPVVAPSVPDGVRELLAVSPGDLSSLPILLGGVLTVLLGTAGGTVLASGAHPRDIDPGTFQLIGAGLLLVALFAVAATARTVIRQRSVRAAHARWGDQVVSADELAAASALPEVGERLDAARRAIADIRGTVPYQQGWLAGTCDEASLNAAEWRVAVAAQAACRHNAEVPPAVRKLLTEQVERVLELRTAVFGLADRLDERRIDDLLAKTRLAPDDAGTTAVVDELAELVRRPTIHPDEPNK
ncbi:hypothetical protein [Pseudonocardia acaciae]|uniref:hypothetical protein n=1 Tax=Pseudonocardia acaciae TaxID=551276 RepID=UPI00048C3A0B|nr:hypothetical protein [Pseudonocardia acaciae]